MVVTNAGIAVDVSVIVANFVSTSQAQRKWFSKFVNKVSNGAYKLGAVSREQWLISNV